MIRAARIVAACLALCPAMALAEGCGSGPIGAAYASPTDRYPHGALGDPLEWGRLTVTLPACVDRPAMISVDLPRELVFEDEAPRLHDVDGDGLAEVIVVESHRDLGSRLVVWHLQGARLTRLAATPFIGQANRWLAPLGAADLDGDGRVELAYIDRPHLAKTLRLWRLENGALVPVASAPGLTNHHFGEARISGGIRDCGQGAEIVTANADWSRLMAGRLVDGRIESREIGHDTGPEGFAAALACTLR
ncbi:FG-GAP repeat domain-containing protein [Pseudodonghicola sp.]|uniref:FG-GAP repeat domain-containing protein n=1 Tax=Pseudodonghicola sp. TaxID=1969463 RepID=UPI003A976EF3